MRAGRVSGVARAVVTCCVVFASLAIASPAGAATVPGAPTGVHATTGDASEVVSWTAPASNGGSAITGYDVFVTPSGRVIHVAGGATTSTTVSALKNGTAYSFNVAARNAVGLGPQSTASPAVKPHVTVSIGDASVWEGTGFAVSAPFAVTLRTAAQEAISVTYTVTAGTATAGTDYTGPSSGTVSFAVGQTTKFVTPAIVGDATAEPSETFTVKLSSPTNAILGDATALGTIRNDDGSPAPNLAVSDATVHEGDTGTRTVQLEIRAKANSFPISVNYSMVRGSAADADVVVTSPQTLQLTGPNTLRSFTIKPDLLKDGDEKFGVYVWSATMSRLDARGVVTIVDNDLTTAPSSPIFPTVTTDVWTPPSPLPPGNPGDVFWSVPTTGTVPSGATTRTMLYRSRSTAGDDIAVSGWLTVPTGTPPAGGWPILAWAHWTKGMADNCAPTHSENPTSIPYISDFIAARYVVVASDYEGLGTPGTNPYFGSESYAHVLLDSIRAAKKMVPAASNRAVLFGGSEGGIVLTAAAELWPYYAPELSVLGGVASGGGVAPSSAALLAALAGSSNRGLALAAVAGLNNAYPAAGVPAYYLTPTGVSELSNVQTYCTFPLLSHYGSTAGLFQSWLTADPLVPPAKSAALQTVEERSSITYRAPAAPLFFAHGRNDTIVPPVLLPPFIQLLCDQRATVELRWYNDGHPPLGQSRTDVVAWIAARFAGTAPAATSCGNIPHSESIPPTVSSIVNADANPTNAASVSWTVTFSEAVTGVTSSNFSLTGSAAPGAAITSVTGSGTTRTVTADTGPGDGILGLDLSDTSNIIDAAANPLNGTYSGDIYTVDKTTPNVLSIVRADANPTSAASVSWTVTFDESVFGVGASNFSLSGSGASGASITSVAGSEWSWTVTASTGGVGTLGLDLTDPTGIQDYAGNALNGTLTGESYDIQ